MNWATPDGIKRNNVDFLRLFLAVLVIYSHGFLISHGPLALDSFDRLTNGQINGGYLLFFIAYAPALHLENFGRHGDYSYGTYLYAFPIQQLIIQTRPGLNPFAIFAVATPLSIAAGALSWYAVEQHFGLRRRRQIREGFTAPTPTPAPASPTASEAT